MDFMCVSLAAYENRISIASILVVLELTGRRKSFKLQLGGLAGAQKVPSARQGLGLAQSCTTVLATNSTVG